MSLTSKILYWWHFIRMNYYYELVDSCIDDELKARLKNKLEYHKGKLNQFEEASI